MITVRRLAGTAAVVAVWALGAAVGNASTASGVLAGDLAAQVETTPDASVDVIVRADAQSHASSAVTAVGGTIRVKLPLIGAVAATVPAKMLPVVVREPGVRAVTSDVGLRPAPSKSSPRSSFLSPEGTDAATEADVPDGLSGAGIGVAVVDSGVASSSDLAGRLSHVSIIGGSGDGFGHGTHVAGIVAAAGPHPGIAPDASVVDVKVTDGQGRSGTATVLRGLQWVADHAACRGIDVVNVSLTAGIGQSARVDPIDAAVEALWRRGIVVVVAAGNRGANANATDFAPANDPLVITVGAADADVTAPADFSSVGATLDGLAKPDLIAPGTGIVSLLAPGALLAASHPEAVTDDGYLKLSGSSMAAPSVAGAAALVLEAHPWYSPDQVKAALLGSVHASGGGGAGILDIAGAVAAQHVSAPQPSLPADSAGLDPVTGLGASDPEASELAADLGDPLTSATWTSATWTSATWTSATWTSATWTSSLDN